MSAGPDEPRGDPARGAAHAWLARLRGSHNAQDEAAFEDWYAADTAHAAAYDAVLDSWDRTALLAALPTEADRLATPDERMARRWPRRALGAAAAAVLAVTGTLAVDQLVTPGGRVEAATLVSRVGEIRTVALSDGSRLTLDTGTVVEAALSERERRFVLRRGRARFAVSPGDPRPFVVVAAGTTVEAPGTTFDAELRGRAVIVSLLSGAVAVRSAGGRRRTLTPGEQLVLGPADRPGRAIPVPTPELRWPLGMLSFENAPLADVVAAANRYAAAPIRLEHDAVRRLRFTGTVRARDQAGLARLLAATFGLAAAQAPSGELVLRAAPGVGTENGNSPPK